MLDTECLFQNAIKLSHDLSISDSHLNHKSGTKKLQITDMPGDRFYAHNCIVTEKYLIVREAFQLGLKRDIFTGGNMGESHHILL